MDDPSSAIPWLELHRFSGQIIAIVLCWTVLAFSSLSEAALVRMEVARARQLAEEKGWVGRRLLDLVENRQEVLSSLILLINVAIIAASAYTTEIAIRLSGNDERWITIASVGMIAILLVFCEVTPKTYGVRRAELIGLTMAPVLFVIHRLIRPFGRVLHAIGIFIIQRALVPVLGGNVLAGLPQYSDQEMLEMVVEGHTNGDIEQEEREMIAGVIEFADKVAREVMTPRTDIKWVAADAPLLAAAQLSEETGYSRLPVCAEDVDHVVGILYMKDIVSVLGEHKPDLTAGHVARRPVPMVPESKKIHEVLHLMQRRRLHMAVVIDEYGGTAGLVTIEDLLEEIFGEIRDEHDFEVEPINVLDANAAVVDARVSVDDLEDHLEVTLPEGDFDSVGGFMLDRLGHLPTVGESVRWRHLEFTIESVSENRIERVRIARRSEEGDNGEESQEE